MTDRDKQIKAKLIKIRDMEIWKTKDNDPYEALGICKDAARDALALFDEPCQRCGGFTQSMPENQGYNNVVDILCPDCQSKDPLFIEIDNSY